MLSKERVRHVRESIGRHRGPVLSLYIDTNPANPANTRKGWLLRAKNSIQELGIPEPVQEQVSTLLEGERPEARTLALFAAEDLRERYDLQVELPVVDLAHGRVEARWGDPYVTPLLYAFDEYERAGLVWLDREGWRFYEVFLGEIEEETEVFRRLSPEEWHELRKYDPARHIGAIKTHTGSDQERYARRVETWAHRYYMLVGHMLEHAVARLGIHRLVLLGPEPNTAFFEGHLPRSIRDRVIAHVRNVPEADASPGKVLEKVAPVLEAREREEEKELLEQIRDQPGVWGTGPTLDALQSGRLQVLVAPWTLETNVWRCPEGWAGDTTETARTFCPSDQPVQVRLKDIIADLAADFGTELEIVRGEPEQMLTGKFGGLAGLRRW